MDLEEPLGGFPAFRLRLVRSLGLVPLLGDGCSAPSDAFELLDFLLGRLELGLTVRDQSRRLRIFRQGLF